MVSRLKSEVAHARSVIGRGHSARGFYARRLRYGDLVFDIGANKGLHTEAMLRRGARVVAVEPQAELASRLRRLPNVTVVQAAVADRPGEAVLHTASADDEHATLNDSWVAVGDVPFDGSRAVEVTTLDALITRFGTPRLVKIDVEGFEDKALAGLNTAVEHVLFEMHRRLIDVADRALARLERLGSYEYRLMPRKAGHDLWVLGPRTTPAEIVAGRYEWADVYARHVPPR